MSFTPRFGTDSLKATLRSIRDLVSRRWMKYDFTDGHGRYCLLGAIHKVDGSFEDRAKAKIRARVKARTGEGMIASFNDDDSTKKRDVLAVLDEAIARVKA
jgi:hypothetical protein